MQQLFTETSYKKKSRCCRHNYFSIFFLFWMFNSCLFECLHNHYSSYVSELGVAIFQSAWESKVYAKWNSWLHTEEKHQQYSLQAGSICRLHETEPRNQLIEFQLKCTQNRTNHSIRKIFLYCMNIELNYPITEP